MIRSLRYAASLAALLASGLAVLCIATLAVLAAAPAHGSTLTPPATTLPAGEEGALIRHPAGPESGAPSDQRQAELRNLLTQDCGSCHGLTLAGGLGPPLLPQALAGKPPEYLAATILYGRPGTAMPPWRPFLSDREAAWLANLLKQKTP
jgi:cytochrome c55X